MGHTGVLDGAVDVEAAGEVEEALVTTAVDEAAAEDETCPVAVDPVARVAAGVGRPLRILILCASCRPPNTTQLANNSATGSARCRRSVPTWFT